NFSGGRQQGASVPSFRSCSRVSFGLIALAGALVASGTHAQNASDFDKTLDSGDRTAPTFQQQTKAVSDAPTRFGQVAGSKTTTSSSSGPATDRKQDDKQEAKPDPLMGSGAGTTGSASSNPRKNRAAKKAKVLSQKPPQLSAAEADAARQIAR